MGCSYYCYFGTYVIAKNRVSQGKIEISNLIRNCLNKDCVNFTHDCIKSPFCPNCGSEIEDKYEKIYKDDFPVLIENESLMKLYRGDCDIWLPNINYSSKYMIMKNYYQEFEKQINKESILDEIESDAVLFKNKFKKELDDLKNNYQSVEVVYGFLNYSM